MAKDGWRERLTKADWKNWQWAYDRFAERAAAEWAEHPNNPSLAQKMYGQSNRFDFPRLADYRRFVNVEA